MEIKKGNYMATLSLWGAEQEELWKDCKKQKPFEVAATIGGEHIGSKRGVHGASTFSYAFLRHLLMQLRRGVFLDLGSGSGEAVIYGAYHGWSSHGIDFCLNAYDFSANNIQLAEAAGYIRPGLAKVAPGNFFPLDFNVERSPHDKEDGFGERLEKHRQNCESPDPYRQLGITPSHVDLFYHFQVERRENILRFISEHGKPGARLLFTASIQDTFKVPGNIRELASNGPFSLYEKEG